VRTGPRLEGKDAPSCPGVDVCGTGGDWAIPSPRAGGGLLRGDSGSEFFGWRCGMRVKGALGWGTRKSLVDGR